ncbi:hypothetical protein H7J87_11365 [Mycolicibacterium wolinskyi]|uniref:Mammalian cell entry protein n=1 Tax=Mycolicibacterium wolinskyi TaxID=59750 RepID=A0A1X2FDF1_9MYCO|nr:MULTISPECIES: hypothetical protein [Mycolicibacterium]MCV7285927.1 hypothetical protein [Mycolicibacterium wolinskyi]MCV7290996.1 hypothetical protein [Mycolicibacterium goodii]ORX16348.1 hypothetical protein AWC31_20025 [Mycolicibacterium wolinskyi]
MSGRHSLKAFDKAGAKPIEDPVEETAEDAAEETAEDASEAEGVDTEPEPPAEPARRTAWSRIVVFAVLPALALVLAAGSAFLKWQIVSERESATARTESVEAAKDITVQMLSYEPDTVEQHLNSVLDRLTGEFLGTYTTMIRTTIIPGATAQRVTAHAEVPAIGSVTASPDRAEVMLYLNQFVTVGDQPPQKTPSTVRVTMVREDGRWLMSQFEPVKP